MNTATKRPAQHLKSLDTSPKRRRLAPAALSDTLSTAAASDAASQGTQSDADSPPAQQQQQQQLQQSSSQQRSDVFDARGILKERHRRGRTEYLVDWEGVDPQTGEAYLPSWEPEENVGDFHIRVWRRKKDANRKKANTTRTRSSSHNPSNALPLDASLDHQSATATATPARRRRRRNIRRLVIEDSPTDTDFADSIAPSNNSLPRTPALDSDAASTQPFSAPHSPSLEILDSQQPQQQQQQPQRQQSLPSSLPFAVELPIPGQQHHINPADFEPYHSSQHSSYLPIQPASAELLSQVSNLQSSGKPANNSSGILTAAHQRVLGVSSSSSIIHFRPDDLSQPGLLQLSDPRSSPPWQFRSQLLSPLAVDPDFQAAMDLPGTQSSPRPAAATAAAATSTETSRRALTPQPVNRPQSRHGRLSAPPPSLSVADYSAPVSYDDLSTLPSSQAYANNLPSSQAYANNTLSVPSSAAAAPIIYDPVSSGSALPIQESIEDEAPSSSAEEASLVSKASSSQASLENERLIPQIDGVSLPLQPVLGPAEYTISLPAEGKIQSAYTDTIKAKRKSIVKFIRRRDSVGSANGSISRTRERNEMIELIERLHDTTTHFDLGLPGFSTQFHVRSEEHAAFAQYAGSKFVFLGCLVDALSTVDCTVIIAAKAGPVQLLIEEFLIMKRIHVTRHDRPNSARSKTPDFHQTTLKIDLVDTAADADIDLSSRPVLLVAFDASFDNQAPQIRRIREANARGRNQLLPVVHLLTSNSSEHIDRCLRKSMPSPQRLKLLVRGTYQAQNNLGGSPTYVPDPSDHPEGRPMDMNDLQRAVRKSPNRKLNMMAHIVARAAITEDFEQYWTLGAMPDVQYDDLDDGPPPPELSERSTAAAAAAAHDRSRTPISRAGTPSGKKRLLDPDDIKLQAVMFKRLRTSPQIDAHEAAAAAAALGNLELELRETIKALQADLSSEKQARQRAEDDLEREKKRSADWEKAHNAVMQRYDLRRLKQHKLGSENRRLQGLVDAAKEKQAKLVDANTALKEQVASLTHDVEAARAEVRASAVPELAALETARAEAREVRAKAASLEKQLQNKQQDFDFTRQQYQEASSRAAELGHENADLAGELAGLRAEASDERRRLRELSISQTTRHDLERIDALEQEKRALERLVRRLKEDVDALKKTRAGVQTRGSSVQPPGSPGGVAAGTRSRQASPAVSLNHRVIGLRNER